MKTKNIPLILALLALPTTATFAQIYQNFSDGTKWYFNSTPGATNGTHGIISTNLVSVALTNNLWNNNGNADQRPREEYYRPNTIALNHTYTIIFNASLAPYNPLNPAFGGCFFQLFPQGNSTNPADAFSGVNANFLLQAERDTDSDYSSVGTFTCYNSTNVVGAGNNTSGSYKVSTDNIDGYAYSFNIQIKCMTNSYGWIHAFISEGADTTHWVNITNLVGANAQTPFGTVIKCGSYSEGVGSNVENPSDHQDFNNQTNRIWNMTIYDQTDTNYIK